MCKKLLNLSENITTIKLDILDKEELVPLSAYHN